MLEHLTISWGVVRDVQGGFFFWTRREPGRIEWRLNCGPFCGPSAIGPFDHWMRAASVASANRRRRQPIDFGRN
jgi:hypothetical protein